MSLTDWLSCRRYAEMRGLPERLPGLLAHCKASGPPRKRAGLLSHPEGDFILRMMGFIVNLMDFMH